MDGQLIYSKRRKLRAEHRDLALKGCYTVIICTVALFLIRPLMVKQILDRADACAVFGQSAEARRLCDKALLLDNNNSRGWCQLARILKAQGDRDQAYGAYQKSTETDATNKPAHLELATMYIQDGHHQLAIPYFEQIRSLGPETARDGKVHGFPYHRAALDMLVLCYRKVGDEAKAEFTLKEIKVFYPNFVRTGEPLARSGPKPD
jgi:tetratricopeptide (TPR) repeat protein